MKIKKIFRFSYRLRVKIAFFLLIFVMFFSQLRIFLSVITNPLIGKDSISQYISRFDLIPQTIPSRGIIGYVTDKEFVDFQNNPNEIARFYLAQYALSPAILVNSTAHRFIIGNFHNKNSYMSFLSKNKNIKIIYDSKNGVVVFEK